MPNRAELTRSNLMTLRHQWTFVSGIFARPVLADLMKEIQLSPEGKGNADESGAKYGSGIPLRVRFWGRNAAAVEIREDPFRSGACL